MTGAVRAALADPARLPAHLQPGWRQRLGLRLRRHRRWLWWLGAALLLAGAGAALWRLHQAGLIPGFAPAG